MGLTDSRLSALVGCEHPLVQAPMARVGTPELVAAVCEAGALGSLAGAMVTPDELRSQIRTVRELTSKPFAVNVFAPLEPVEPGAGVVERMSEVLAPWRERLGLEGDAPPPRKPPDFDEQLAILLEERPAAFSFTFGIPPEPALAALRDAGIRIFGTATTVGEAEQLERAGCDAVVAQGSEAGGHRGTFAAEFEAALVGTVALVPQVADRVSVPVIAAGGIMDGRGVAAALALGADAAQLGTAFVVTTESGAPPAYVDSLTGAGDTSTKVTAAFTGRPARGIRTPFFDGIESSGTEIPPYPRHQDLTLELLGPGLERDELDVVVRLAGQGAPLARRMGAGELVGELVREAEAVLGRLAR
jgi:nitronate monooxygenase